MPLMKCGHAANATKQKDGSPVCIICYGKPEAEQVAETPDLSGRTAHCTYTRKRDGSLCQSEKPSSPALAFFEHRPLEAYDRFYCGCWGWD